MTRTGFYGEQDLKAGQKVRIVLTAQITKPNARDYCMQVATSSGMYHYIFDGDPAAVIIPVEASWPPKVHDVWLFGNRLWHVDNKGNLAYATTDRFSMPRKPESVLHSADTAPELLFRWRV